MDYYNTLGINKAASQDEIRKAYKKMSMKHHPDRGGDETKFKEINQAYQTLSDPERKQMYDQYGTDDPQKMGGMGGNPFGGFGGGGFEDMFSTMFGQGFANRQVRKNRDIQVVQDIDLEDVIFGKTIPLTYRIGSGKVETVTVEVPIGIQPGQTVRYQGLGDDTHSQLPRGDLLVKIRVKRHHVWDSSGSNLYREIPVGVFDLMLGTTVQVAMIDGKKIDLKIPSGTKPNAKLSVPGYGMPERRSGRRGNAIIIVKAIIPAITNEEHLEKIRELKNALSS
jgi:DnaJ-class molecular chaperone